MIMFVAAIRNRKRLENCKSQIMLGESVKEPLMNLQKYLKEGFSLVFLIYAYPSFKDDLD